MNIPVDATITVALPYYPLQTIRCAGPAVFRSQAARDYGCLLDVDDDVREWGCLIRVENRDKSREADFIVRRVSNGDTVVDVTTVDFDPSWTSITVVNFV